MNTPVPVILDWDWLTTLEWYAEARHIDDSKAKFSAALAGAKTKRKRKK